MWVYVCILHSRWPTIIYVLRILCYYVDDLRISFHRYKAVISHTILENSFHRRRRISREGSIQSIPWNVKSTEGVESILLYNLPLDVFPTNSIQTVMI